MKMDYLHQDVEETEHVQEEEVEVKKKKPAKKVKKDPAELKQGTTRTDR